MHIQQILLHAYVAKIKYDPQDITWATWNEGEKMQAENWFLHHLQMRL